MNTNLINKKLMSFFEVINRQDFDVMLERLGCLFLLENNEYRTIANRILCEKYTHIYFRECTTLFQEMDDENIIFAVLKGAVLSSQIYGQNNVKISKDIDILVSNKDVDLLKNILLKHGFIQGRILNDEIIPFERDQKVFYSRYTHQQAPWIKKTKEEICPYICIDINTSLLWGEAEPSDCLSDFLTKDSIEPCKIFGIELYKLKKEYEFIALCLHHYKDLNSIYLLYSQGVKLKHFVDIYLYVNKLYLNYQTLVNICNTYRLKKYVYYCVAAANCIFNDDKLLSLEVMLYEEEYDKILDEYGLTDTEMYRWEISLKDRILYGNLQEYFHNVLSTAEKDKIKINEFYLH